ncbi:MAG TPA: alpha-L-rhamnosidase, partial [Candidatus Hydrogenedentes bacterium]|nr:alpha-L-rhamnosidase [Candidatus Hydrogenedentota bacterium]
MLEVFMIAALVLLVAAPSAADVFGEAEWIRDPVFEGITTIDFYHKEDAPQPKLYGPKNVHTLLRNEIEVIGTPERALLRVTGDDYYTLYLNGRFLVQGPEPGYPFAHPYYELDIAEHVKQGTNVIAVHLYYQGLRNRVWNSADNRSGFIFTLDVAGRDGTTERFVTDGTWRCHRLEAFPAAQTTGYDTQFAEHIDMRAMPVGWRDPGFDDRAWNTPLSGRQDHVFVKQITPPLERYRIDPAVAKRKGDGHYFYAFPTEIVGHTRIRIRGPAGHRIEVRHGEELEAPEQVRYDMRCNTKYQEFPVLSGREDVIEFYDYRAFRYIEILDAPAEPEVWVMARHHPFPQDAAALEASDSLLERIWQLCANGVRRGAQGSFLDCPTREKGQYLGDALITGHSHLVLTGDGSLVKKALKDFQLSQRVCPGIMAVAPGSFMQEIAEYSLQYPMVLANYYRFTGDRVFTEQIIDAVFDKLYGYFARFESDAGLLANMTEKWVLVDWPKNLRDDYDYDYAEKRENAVLNAFYCASLRTAADLLRALGREDAATYTAKAERVKQAYIERLIDPATGL